MPNDEDTAGKVPRTGQEDIVEEVRRTNENGGHPRVSRWARLVGVLVLAVIAWRWLAVIAMHARVAGGGGATGVTIADLNTGKEWATQLLGLAGALAGFLGIATGAQDAKRSPDDRARSAYVGVFGVIGGATLLGVGGWAVPVGLGAMAVGAATDRVMRLHLGEDL